MTLAERAAEVWAMLVDPEREPDVYRAVDYVMEDGHERGEVRRALHAAAHTWLREKYRGLLGDPDRTMFGNPLALATCSGDACRAFGLGEFDEAEATMQFVPRVPDTESELRIWCNYLHAALAILRAIDAIPEACRA